MLSTFNITMAYIYTLDLSINYFSEDQNEVIMIYSRLFVVFFLSFNKYMKI